MINWSPIGHGAAAQPPDQFRIDTQQGASAPVTFSRYALDSNDALSASIVAVRSLTAILRNIGVARR